MMFVWLAPTAEGRVIYAVGRLSVVAFFVSVAAWTVWHLALAQRVTARTLLGAVSGYLLVGIAFAVSYAMLEVVAPGALRLGEARSSDLVYFSFITLATVGYGDITPVSAAARMLAVAEAVIGQFYVAAVVARLISLFVAPPQRPPKEP
jgi:hypothetical protein